MKLSQTCGILNIDLCFLCFIITITIFTHKYLLLLYLYLLFQMQEYYRILSTFSLILLFLIHHTSSQNLCNQQLCLCNSNNCTECLSTNYFTSPSSPTCLPCHFNCASCQSLSVCNQCAGGYYFNASTNGCEQCQIYCSTCSNPKSCTKCMDGYYLAQGQQKICKKCSLPFAQTCSSETSVTTCINGYWKNGDSCSPCRQFCSKCTSSTNCFTCIAGYRTQLSAGTYCVPCPSGCQTCNSNDACVQCFGNYRLISGLCVSIAQQCQSKYGVNTCKQCVYRNGVVQCSICEYPYYLSYSDSSQPQCILGASILCTEGAMGRNRYECLAQCGDKSTQIDQLSIDGLTQTICSPSIWIDGITQHYLNGRQSSEQFKYLREISSSTEQNCLRTKLSSLKTCQNTSEQPQQNEQHLVYSPSLIISSTSSTTVTLTNKITITKTLTPYYKLFLTFKYYPLYKTKPFITEAYDDIIQSVSYQRQSVTMRDNSSNVYYLKLDSHNPSQIDRKVSSGGICGYADIQPEYLSFQSKIVKDQKVTIEVQASIVVEYIPQPDIQLSELQQLVKDNYQYGLIAYSQLLIEVYRCSEECRMCSNTRYCLQCLSPYFLYDHQCVDQCYGFFQFYRPNGDPNNYTSISCQQQCPAGFYSVPHPSVSEDTGRYICKKCEEPCQKCKSQTECLSCQQGYLYYDLAFSCILQCPITHYSAHSSILSSGNATVQNVCLPCNSPCKTCTNSTACLSCVIGYLQGIKCIGKCGSGKYETTIPNTSDKVCAQCSAQCATCTKQASSCLSCVSGYYLVGYKCVQECPLLTHYRDEEKKICQICEPPCLLCESQSKCVSCVSTYFYYDGEDMNQTESNVSNCLSECPLGYFKSFTNNACVACAQNCIKCLSSTICEVCQLPTFLENSRCVQTCAQKTYGVLGIDGKGLCVPCVSPCNSCNSSNYCLSCQIGFLSQIQPGKCSGTCEPGFYSISSFNSNRQCHQCSVQCATCSESPDKCLSCTNTSLFLDKIHHTCIEECVAGYYPRNGVCVKCSYPCSTCASKSISCLSCELPYILAYTAIQNTTSSCVSQCGQTEYIHSYLQVNTNTTKKICKKCIYPCKSCVQSADKCISCVVLTSQQVSVQNLTQTYLNSQSFQCLPQCQNQFQYKDALSYRCKDCVFPCRKCLSSTKCLSCQKGFYMPQTNKCQMCPSGYFGNTTSGQCQVCSLSAVIAQFEGGQFCQICSTDGSACLACNDNYFLFTRNSGNATVTQCLTQQQCEQNPIKGYYPNQQQMVCSRCISPCQQCYSQSVCKTCAVGYLLTQGDIKKCVTQCPEGYYATTDDDTNAKICGKCNEQICLTCSISATRCLKCNLSGVYPVFRVQDSLCIQESQCSEEQGFYIDQIYGYPRCLKCQLPCQTCSKARHCLSCAVGAGILYEGQCRYTCPNGYFINSQASCEQCSDTCQQCHSNATTCISCPSSKYLQQTSCVSSCSNGYYLQQNSQQCKKCSPPCQQCLMGSHCLSCQSDEDILYYGQCISMCPDGTYIAQQTDVNSTIKSCVQCPQQCQLCSFDDNTSGPMCKRCSIGLYMNSSQYGACQPQCSQTQYPDIYTRSCYPCQAPCISCLSGTACLTCTQGYILYHNDCVKGQICPLNTFKSYNSQDNISQCVDHCVDGQLGDSFTRQCVKQQCLYNYVKLFTNVTVDGQQKVAGWCIKKCPFNYYLSSVDKICVRCPSTSQPKSGFIFSTDTKQQCSTESEMKLLFMSSVAKSIFNSLYIRLTFSQEVDLTALYSSTDVMFIQYNQLKQEKQTRRRRRLQGSSQIMEFQVLDNTDPSQKDNIGNTVWLKLYPNKTLSGTQLLTSIPNYYMFPGQTLQNSNSTYFLNSFDYYQSPTDSKSFQTLSQFLSICMCIFFLINLITNTGYLLYNMVDYYQILFILLFLNVDYPPNLNYFFNGFRYAHYLFLPQIFSAGQAKADISEGGSLKMNQNTPAKFGIIVSDANFLTNTGHDFLIMFVVISIFVLLKTIECCGKDSSVQNLHSSHITTNNVDNRKSFEKGNSNRIRNQNETQSSNSSMANQPNKDEKKQVRQQPIQNKPFKHRLLDLVRTLLHRVKWNYFNDFLYIMYFYLTMFAFAQTYNMQASSQTQHASSIFAVLFILLSVGWVIFLWVMLYMKNSKEELFQQENQGQKQQKPKDDKKYLEGMETVYVDNGENNEQNSMHKMNALFKENDVDNKKGQTPTQKPEQQKIQYYSSKTQYKCFVWNVRKSSSLGLYHMPIRYTKKLILAILFIYCGKYQNFILGALVMSALLAITASSVYRPFRNKMDLLLYCIFEGLFGLGCLGLCVLMASSLEMDPSQKMQLGSLIVSIFIILSFLLFVYNLGIIILQGIKFCSGINYMSKLYYPQDDDNSASTEMGKQQILSMHGSDKKQENMNMHEDSNTRLRILRVKNDGQLDESQYDNNGKIRKHESEVGSQSSGLGIYLHKNPNAPQMLIKCVKGSRFVEDQHPSESENDEKNKQKRDERSYVSKDEGYGQNHGQKIGDNQKDEQIEYQIKIVNGSKQQEEQIKKQWQEKSRVIGVLAIENNQFQPSDDQKIE